LLPNCNHGLHSESICSVGLLAGSDAVVSLEAAPSEPKSLYVYVVHEDSVATRGDALAFAGRLRAIASTVETAAVQLASGTQGVSA
jgi:hypothetical protein